MALFVKTAAPDALWNKFSGAISNKTIETWQFHQDGVHFTHTAPQWRNRAWFRAVSQQGALVFNIVKPTGSTINVEVYAEYHGLLLRAFLAHFDRDFTGAEATALASSGDIVAELTA